MKRLATVSTFTFILVSCASAVSYSDNHRSLITPAAFSQASPGSSFINTLIGRKEKQTIIEQEIAAQQARELKEQKIRQQQFENQRAIAKRIVEIKQYSKKTWYVFSGSSPRGWDCSGLVVWFYEGLGIEIPHSASKQGLLKPKIKNPRPGDIVVFRQQGYRNFHHSAVYIGDNKIIHSGFQKGDRTEIVSLDNPIFADSDVKFIRILELPVE